MDKLLVQGIHKRNDFARREKKKKNVSIEVLLWEKLYQERNANNEWIEKAFFLYSAYEPCWAESMTLIPETQI